MKRPFGRYGLALNANNEPIDSASCSSLTTALIVKFIGPEFNRLRDGQLASDRVDVGDTIYCDYVDNTVELDGIRYYLIKYDDIIMVEKENG